VSQNTIRFTRDPSLSHAKLVQSIRFNYVCLITGLKLSYQLRLHLQVFFSSRFHTKILYVFLFCSMRATCLLCLIFLDLFIVIICARRTSALRKCLLLLSPSFVWIISQYNNSTSRFPVAHEFLSCLCTFTGVLLNTSCYAGNFGNIWSECKQPQIQYTKCIRNPVCIIVLCIFLSEYFSVHRAG